MKLALEVLKDDELIVNGSASSEDNVRLAAFGLRDAFPDAIVHYQTSPVQWAIAAAQSLDDIPLEKCDIR